MFWRLDLHLLEINRYDGPIFAALLLVTLGVVAFAKVPRAFVVGIALLLSSQLWFRPLVKISHVLRWWVLVILTLRGGAYIYAESARSMAPGRMRMTAFALAMLALVSAVWARDPLYTVALAATLVLGLTLCFSIAWRLLDSHQFLPRLCSGALVIAATLYFSGVFFAAVALVTEDWQLANDTGIYGRYSGIMNNPNACGLLGAVLFPIILAAPREYVGRLSKIRWPTLVVLGGSIVLSGSRTAVGAMLLGALVIVLYRYRAGAVVTLGACAMFGAMFVFLTPPEDIEGSRLDEMVLRSESLDDFGGRREMWEMGWDVAMERPILGHGFAASRVLGGKDTRLSLRLGRVKRATNFHSAHISLLIDLGWVGLGLFWLFLAQVIWAGMRIMRSPPTPSNMVAVVFFASVMGMIADTFVHSAVLSVGGPNALVFWFSCALVLRHAQRLGRGEAAHVPAPEPDADPDRGLVPSPAAAA